MPNRSCPHYFVDNGKEPDLEVSYFMSLRFNYLPLRSEDSYIFEPYSPHRFSRQFRFYQDTPGVLESDIRSASLADGLRFSRICVYQKSMSKATFPNTTSNVRKLSSSEYKSWWAKVHRKYLEDKLQLLVAAVGPITDIRQEHNEEVFADKSLALKSKAVLLHKSEGLPCTDIQKEKMLPQAYQASKKRPPKDESDSSHGDRCPKRFRPPVDEPRNTTSHAVEIHDSDISSSRTLTATKEPNSVNILVASHQSKSQDSSESVAGPDSQGSLPISKSEREATSISHGRSKPNLGLSSRKPLATSMSVFDGKKVVMTLRKNFVLEAWTKIQAKFSNLSVDCASSLEDEVKVILEEMDGKDLDISLLKKLLDSFFELSTSYDQARSALVDKAAEVEKSESFVRAKEHLDLVLAKKDEKAKKLSATRRSLKAAKKKVKELRALKNATEKDVEEFKSKVSTAEYEYRRCADISQETANNSADVEEKRRYLEANLQDLVNDKFCLD